MSKVTLSAAVAFGVLIGSVGVLAAAGTRGGAATSAAVAEAPASLGLPTSAAGDYAADAVHSSVVFRVTHAGVTNFYGRFNKMDGQFTLADNPSDLNFNFRISTESIDTNSADRDRHLRSPDFFNTAQFSEARFVSTGVAAGAGDTHKLSGDLTLNGVTKPITADLKITGTGEFRGKQVAGFEARFAIDRREFGITTYDGPIGAEVHVVVSVEGVKQ